MSISQPEHYGVQRIISGGQTGVDRAALDTAISLGITHGGWCPLGRLAEDGIIPSRYELQETATADYPARTEQNVVSSDGTLILYRRTLHGGTQLTHRLARKHGRPCELIDLEDSPDFNRARDWLRRHSIHTLNVAGPRESSAPGITLQAADYLNSLLDGLA